ncbi:MAG: hypothetical protein HY677_07450, partial [Chloroflexi bacterium]|nr:hypothetical protein [Chloroflexota bacterium]
MSAEEHWARRNLTVGIVGLGYVGLPLAMAFAQKGFTVVGVDLDVGKVARINKGESYVLDVDSAELSQQTQASKIRAGTDYATLSAADAIFICVPTPLG